MDQGDRHSRINLGALAVSISEITGISRKEAWHMEYREFLVTYLDALQVSKERERKMKN